MIGWFTSLSARERILLLVALPVIMVIGGYRLVWIPLHDLRATYTRDISNYRLVVDTARLAAQADRPTAPRPTPDTPIAERITQSAETTNLALRRIEPSGTGMRVTLDDVPFATVLLWLADLEQEHRVTATSVEIDRRPEPGIVSARLLLDELQ